METELFSLESPVECRIVERLNRFVVKVCHDSHYYRAHINNTGRLSEFLIKGRKGFCIRQEEGRKTDYRLFAVEESNLGAIIDTQLQMKAFEKSLAINLIPWLKGYKVLKRNARSGNSLIDYLLVSDAQEIFLEVKSAALREGDYAMYPDCPSSRGRKHIRELTSCLNRGGKAIIVFIAALPEVQAFKPNKAADPELYDLLVEAHKVGVEVRSIALYYNPKSFSVHLSNTDLKIDF
ncbi:MAG: DNA/RNA nuclease SfsA [Dehalococcoidales bacterium]|nr:DNA/RNA nuclease SfsA [Dehalococcoidales bacterium]